MRIGVKKRKPFSQELDLKLRWKDKGRGRGTTARPVLEETLRRIKPRHGRWKLWAMYDGKDLGY